VAVQSVFELTNRVKRYWVRSLKYWSHKTLESNKSVGKLPRADARRHMEWMEQFEQLRLQLTQLQQGIAQGPPTGGREGPMAGGGSAGGSTEGNDPGVK